MVRIQMNTHSFSRRSFLAAIGAAPLVMAQTHKQIPVGLELYTVRHDLTKDLTGTVQKVAEMGYPIVEFFAPYYQWSPDRARQVRKELDRLNIKCYSTHNGMQSFTSQGIEKAIELNNILGTRFVVLASPGNIDSIDGWKHVAGTLDEANRKLARHGLHAGYHNHDAEWKPIDGQRPMDVLAANTAKSIMLQLDVGTCVAAGADPVAWVNKNPGRIRCMHLKDWSPAKGYRVLFGQGVVPWKRLFAAAEGRGGAEYYLIEQEGSQYPELETAKLCLMDYRKLRGLHA